MRNKLPRKEETDKKRNEKGHNISVARAFLYAVDEPEASVKDHGSCRRFSSTMRLTNNRLCVAVKELSRETDRSRRGGRGERETE